MNCETFQEMLPEYLDEALASAELADARRHLEQCADCRRVLLREEALAKSLRVGLQHEAEGLSLGAETRRNILKAVEGEPAPTRGSASWAFLKSILLRPALAGAALAGVLLVLLARQLYRGPASDAGPAPKNREEEFALVIDVPMQVQSHKFRQQDHSTVDVIITSVSVGRADFLKSASDRAKPPSK